MRKAVRALAAAALSLLLLAPAGAAGAEAAAPSRQERFLYLLRTYPERPPDQTLAQVAALVEEGPFAERDRAIYWLGSARLSLGDRAGLRALAAKLARDYPGSTWVERSYLGLADAAAQERHFDEARSWYALAGRAADAGVRELARIALPQIVTLQNRQRAAWSGQAAALAIALWLFLSALRLERARRGAGLREALLALSVPPPEARVLLPVLLVVCLIALQQDPAPRGAVLELAVGGALLTWLSAARLRALAAAAPRRARLGQVALALVAMACVAYTAVWRGDLVGMVLETVRAGTD